MNQEKLFEKTSPMKLFFLAAIPGGISMLASSLYGLLDGIFVGRILGEASFAALNLAFPFVVINFSLADLIGVGSSVPISIQLGKKKEKEANNIFSCACLMIIITGALLGGFMYLAAPWLIHLLGAEGELAELAVQYMRVYALCSPVTTIVFAMDNYLRICGKIRSSMNLNILMSVLSAALEFIFLGIFRWGIWSAALATCSGMFICAVIAVFPFVRGKLQLRLCKPRFNVSMIRQIIVCGSPNFLSNIAGRITSIIMNIVLLQFGGATAVSIYGVLMYTGETIQSFLY
ncbi:MAG TPA: MATE family efflux transporter, partial [Lachnoclostridium phytofermentans]|nr:MATE family efflux transporter [Lachnoclostridium phytofermentans]